MHGGAIEFGCLIRAAEFEVELFEEGVVLEVAGEEQDVVGVDFSCRWCLAGVEGLDEYGVGLDLFDLGFGNKGDSFLVDQPFEFGFEPVFDPFGVEFRAAVDEGYFGASAVESDGGFDGGILSADDGDVTVEVLVDFAEVVTDMGEGFAGNVEEAGVVHVADGEDEIVGSDIGGFGRAF